MASPWSTSMRHESLVNPSDAKPYVKMIVTALQDKKFRSYCGFKVREVIEGGSLGQGTAVPDEFDLDLVIYSEDITTSDMLNKARLKQYLEALHSFLSQQLPRGQYKRDSLTDHALRCVLGGELEADILLSPYWDTVDNYHSYLETLPNSKRRMFSCSAAKWQKEFFEIQPDNIVKEYIKRAKTWRNKKWPTKKDGIGRPKSILIGLLVIAAYNKSKTGGEQSVTDIMKNFVRGHNRLEIDFEDALYSSRHKRQFPSRPYIIDPANPFNNVYLSGISKYKANSPEGTYEPGDGNWTMFVHHIDSLDLRKIDGTRY